MSQTPAPQTIPRLPKLGSPATSTASRWQAVVTRDPIASFVYAVITTKIYCRPSCAARLARRANVEFYDTPSQAEEAGFRPCKRCKPEENRKHAINPQVAVVQRACRTIEADVRSGSKPTLSRLAEEASLTPSHFLRVFKKVVGVTPGKYVAAVMKDSEGAPLDSVGDDPSIVENRGIGMMDWLGNPGSEYGDLGCAVSAGGENALLWNEFDVLIAAEAEYASRQRI
ncbi:putative DNA repair and transcription factor Ada [Aspergillus foveolatus]|uniref:putative DNA repair and transcription factor Ada n=1 Tax=Aspergillus foveolatus TaxID=210207 RepID=UPI003CCCC759